MLFVLFVVRGICCRCSLLLFVGRVGLLLFVLCLVLIGDVVGVCCLLCVVCCVL